MPDPTMFCDEEELTQLYGWIDDIETLTRDKRNITRDFADGVMVAEVLHNFLPRMVELHNYQKASSKKAKLNNWNTINTKVLKKIGVCIPMNVMEAIVNGIQGVVEVVLIHIRNAILRVTKPKAYARAQLQIERKFLEKESDYEEARLLSAQERKERTVLEEPEDVGEGDVKGKKKRRKRKDSKKSSNLRTEGSTASGGDGGDEGKLPDINKKKGKRKPK